MISDNTQISDFATILYMRCQIRIDVQNLTAATMTVGVNAGRAVASMLLNGHQFYVLWWLDAHLTRADIGGNYILNIRYVNEDTIPVTSAAIYIEYAYQSNGDVSTNFYSKSIQYPQFDDDTEETISFNNNTYFQPILYVMNTSTMFKLLPLHNWAYDMQQIKTVVMDY